ncbi:hypothetical protein EMIHUDRAFT_463474 [Emiliania huxleyi CCMP1516]|uniref:Uncharacterized protein n=2 Tax=Emiliania huxleyi TaxID=2903 RepID=A0A0D3JNQ0_EMIH1|nr:hypothetical protein EMIHUDRAFT_463474 [Emiliania huxleyi CCMP1516]EOD25135.1 hypothetical protein EMIHUDRAFT_463474 [Emiliania huxleyi CCMP1516]|eukprot:XP_005777564.1 hypothetical protein EMIHUDRAFT_463474 [Emiliania huxleyi CCMP1516]
MLNFKSAGVQDGTFDQAAASGQPPRPPGIPEHYIFDTEVELWMPPSAIAKARSRCAAAAAAAAATRSSGEICRYRHLDASHPDVIADRELLLDPGAGETCRYRHLPPAHPDVVADRIRQGKAPSTMPAPAMGGYLESLARRGRATRGLGSAMHGSAAQQLLQGDTSSGGGGGGGGGGGEGGGGGQGGDYHYRGRDYRDREGCGERYGERSYEGRLPRDYHGRRPYDRREYYDRPRDYYSDRRDADRR